MENTKALEVAHSAIHKAVADTLKSGLPNMPDTTRNALAVSLALKLRTQLAERDAQLAAAKRFVVEAIGWHESPIGDTPSDYLSAIETMRQLKAMLTQATRTPTQTAEGE